MISKQTGFSQPQASYIDWKANLVESWRLYFVDTLGLPISLALERAKMEIDGSLASNYCDKLQLHGMSFLGADVLDIGCGHGSMAIEIGRRGGKVIGIEPCASWRQIAYQRMKELPFRQHIKIISGNAEKLPFKNDSFDYILSLQVLEHVQNVKLAIEEMTRVLRPGGIGYVSCENYLAFKEQHYKVAWLPLLPKNLAVIYLRAIGKNPEFIRQNITYTTYPILIWDFLNAGMWSTIWPERYQRLKPFIQYMRLLMFHRRNIFKAGFTHFLVRR